MRPRMPALPERDRVPYPNATTKVTCTIGSKRQLLGCVSDLVDERRTALANYVQSWRVLSRQARGCSVIGRKFSAVFHLRNGS